MAVGCGSRGVRFFHLGAGGMMGLRRRVYVLAAGARARLFVFCCGCEDFVLGNSDGGLSYNTWSH